MNFDIIDNEDSFSTLVEKEQTELIKSERRRKEECKCIITNFAIPVGLIFIFIIILLCCNKQIKDKCGCEFEPDVSTNVYSGTEYIYCVSLNYGCYDKIEYK